MEDLLENPLAISDERRRYIRVYDAVGLHLQRLFEIPAAGQPAMPIPSPRVRKLDKYGIDGYAQVRSDYPAVAEYISELEERIRQLLLNTDEAPTTPTHKVNLSAGGICFSDAQLFHPEELLSLCITLFPTGRRIVSDARVISANDTDCAGLSGDSRPSYRVEFVRMSDTDRRVLETHVDQLLTKTQLLED